RAAAARKLPEYMVPSSIVLRGSLPLTPNGKVDRSALLRETPAPEQRAAAGYVAPRNAAEETLAAIWAEVLGVERIGIHDDFFQLGGHSLLATRVLSRVRRTFGSELALTALFDAPRIADLAARLEGAGRAESPIVPVPRGAPLPPSFGQQRLWFLHQLEPENPEYHIPAAVAVDGPLEVAVLRHGLDQLVRRHETLRTRFAEHGEEAVQVVDPTRLQALPLIDLSALPPAGRREELGRLSAEDAVRLFDLARGPLLRSTLVRLGRAEHVFLLNQHHIISDAWSMGILIRELGELYGGRTLP
ncbi:MAG: non-ribosomal peptide synthetase, partial [bacterium]|nr:non-ribosomal peptide synthetase [bacterium]